MLIVLIFEEAWRGNTAVILELIAMGLVAFLILNLALTIWWQQNFLKLALPDLVVLVMFAIWDMASLVWWQQIWCW